MSGEYTAKVAAANVELDITISEIRKMQDRHEVDCRTAADLRIHALERHLLRVRALREEHFGPAETELPKPNFYPADGPAYGGDSDA